MKNRQIALLLAGLLCVSGSASAAAEQINESAEMQENNGEEMSVEAPEPEAAEAAQVQEAAEAGPAAEIQSPEPAETAADETISVEEWAEESIREEAVEETAAQSQTAAPASEDNEHTVDPEGLIVDEGIEVRYNAPAVPVETEEETETETEDIHRGMFPGFVVDPSKYPAANITENTLMLYCFLRDEMDMSHAGACGILANVHLESNFRPIALGDGGTSYGICQWHNGRFTHLMNYCRREELDYNTLEGQMEFLRYELEHGYKKVYEAIQKVEDDEDGAYMAAYIFCMRFEMPDQMRARAERRGNLCRNEYYDKDFEELAEEFRDNEELRKFFMAINMEVLPDFVIETEVM